jgi:hypothetical protein
MGMVWRITKMKTEKDIYDLQNALISARDIYILLKDPAEAQKMQAQIDILSWVLL